ncbi:PUF domain-containing protein [Cephalotus follicularis]|uniref:PUF domain-containing protein n=1 Tax=Cephalotus follicularis TaxID=3775 RepID=A0A1Q3BTB2_CEPFO|nr:PUF domain-containing protein [Cephalotus follicularis]
MYLQRKVALKDPRITCKIFKGVIGFIFHLMTNKDGSYLFGKLIESCDEIQLQVIVSKITSQSDLFIKAVKDKWGSNSIKNLIKVLVRSHLVSNLIPLLYNEFYGLMIDDIGYSVVVKCIDLLDTETNDLLYQAAFEHYLALAINERGCISLNAFITNSKGLARGQLLTLISGNSLFLAFDPIGNFVVQHVLKLHNPFINEKIFSSLKGHYVSLSQLKGGSHVVERCLESTGTYHVLDDFLRSNDLLKVAQDKYGNYVIQTALRFLKQTHNPLYQNLLMKLQPLLDPTSLQSKYVTKVRNMIASEIWHKKP